MGGSVSLTQLYQLPETIDFQTFMTVTRFKFTPESYQIFADRDGQISRQRMIEIVASRDCYFSYEWGYDSNARSIPNRVQQIIESLTERGLYIYTEDGQYRHNIQMGEMSLRERIKQSLITSQCMILCLTQRYYQKLMEQPEDSSTKGESNIHNNITNNKMNQIQIEFNEFLALKGIRYLIPIFLEEKGKITPEYCPPKIYDLLSTKYVVNMTNFEYSPDQLDELYSIIIKTIKPLREGGNFIRSDLDYAVSKEGKHFHWLSERFNLEEYNISLNENESFKKDILKRQSSMGNVMTSVKMTEAMLANTAKNKKKKRQDSETASLLLNIKNVSKMTISRDLLKKYAKIFVNHNFDTTTQMLPMLQANDDYLLEIGIEKIHADYLRTQILLDIKENFDSTYASRIDAILLKQRSTISREDEERHRILMQQIEASNRMKELSLMLFEDHLSYCYEEYCEMINKQEIFEKKRQLLLQQIDEDNQKYLFLMVSCQQSYERRKFDEIHLFRKQRFERIINGESIIEVIQNFRENLQSISEITLSTENGLNPLASLLSEGEGLRGVRGEISSGNANKTRSSSMFPYGSTSALSTKKGMVVDTSFLSAKSPKHQNSLINRTLSQSVGVNSLPASPSNHLSPSSKQLVPYGLTQQQPIQSDVNATKDPEELSYLLQESVYLFKRMELFVSNSMENVTTLLENSVIKLLLTFVSQQYIHYIAFTSTHFLTNSHFFQLSIPHQPLLLLAHCIRCRTDYNAIHSSLVYLLHRYGVLSLLFEMMKWYIEKLDVLGLCLYLIDLVISTKDHSVLLSYLAPYLSSPATQQSEGRSKSSKSPKKTSVKAIINTNPNEFYLLFLMILLEKYYYHAPVDADGGQNDNNEDDLIEKMEIVYKTPSKKQQQDGNDEKPVALIRPTSVRLLPRTPSGTALLISSPSSGKRSPRSFAGSPRTMRTSPSSPKALLPQLDKQVHLLYERDYREVLLMIPSIFCKLATVEKYDVLLMKCREKLITNLINEIISIPITNISFPAEYYYNFLFSLECLYYTKCILFLPQNPADSPYRLDEKYGVYDCTISYAMKPDYYSPNSIHFNNNNHLHHDHSAENTVAPMMRFRRKLFESMILQLHEFVLIKYLINTFHYYCYHHEYQSIEMIIQIIRVIGNVIYCRNDLKKICYEFYLHKELIYLLRIGLQMLKYQVTASTQSSASTASGQGFSSRELLKDIHVIIQEEDRERRKEHNKSFLRSPKSAKSPSFRTRLKQQFPEVKSTDLEEISEYPSTSPSASHSPSVTSKKAASFSQKETQHTAVQPSSAFIPIQRSLKIDTNPSSMKSSAYSGTDKAQSHSDSNQTNYAKYIHQTRFLGIQLLIETFQTFNNLLIIDTMPSPLMQPKTFSSSSTGTGTTGTPVKSAGGGDAAKSALPLLSECLRDCIEKFNLGEVLSEVFLFLNFDQQLIYAYLLFLHKCTQRGNTIVCDRLMSLGFAEKLLQLLETMFYQSYEESITFDHYLLICQLLVNLCHVDRILINPMKRLIKKKELLISLIMTSMKRFCIAKDYEFAWRYAHFYSQYILSTQDKLYGTTVNSNTSARISKQSRTGGSNIAEAKTEGNNKTTPGLKQDWDEKESEQGSKEEETIGKAVVDDSEDDSDAEELDREHYHHRICISCIMNSKLIYCLLSNDQYEKEFTDGFIAAGIQQFLCSSSAPSVVGDISDLLPVLYSEQSNHNSLAIPQPSQIYAEEKHHTDSGKVRNDSSLKEGKMENQPAPAPVSTPKLYLIPIIDLSSRLLSESNKPENQQSNGNKLDDNTLRRSITSPNKTVTKEMNDPATAPAATNKTATFDSSRLLQQINYSYYLNRNIEFLENIEQKEFDYYMLFLFHKFHLKY